MVLATEPVPRGQRKKPKIIRDEREALAAFVDARVLGFDLETGGLSPWRDPIAVVSLYDPYTNTAAILHVRGYLSQDLREFLGSGVELVGHNVCQFDALFLANNGVDLSNVVIYDTMLGALVASVTSRRDVRVNLQTELRRRTGREISKDQQVSAWMASELNDDQVRYCVDDSQSLVLLKEEQVKACREKGTQGALEFEHRLAHPIMRMTLNGIPLSLEALAAWRLELGERIAEADAYLKGLRPGANVNSPKQIASILADMGVKVSSTNKETLQELADGDGPGAELARQLMLWRWGTKRTDFYDDEWVGRYREADGRVHPRFWACGADTGRLTSTDPNGQQIPRDGRRVFGGLPQHKIVSADYSSIEVVVAAALAGDEELLKDCATGDPHMALACRMTGLPPDQVDREKRRLAKAGNFTILFCGGVNRLYDSVVMGGSEMTFEEVRAFFNEYLATYRGIARMRTSAQQRARDAHVTLRFPTGLRRDLVGDSVRPTILVNNAVQGTAAAGMKFAILECWRAGLGPFLSLTVHDELVLCVPDHLVEEVYATLERCMVTGMRQALEAARVRVDVESVPVSVDPKIGDFWS